jgi:hypothetical protein
MARYLEDAAALLALGLMCAAIVAVYVAVNPGVAP